MYVAFGYFCLSEFKIAKEEIKKQFRVCKDPKYKNGLNYNMEICEGVLFLESGKFYEAVDKFEQASVLCPKKP